METRLAFLGELEIRQREGGPGRLLNGRFAYGKTAVLRYQGKIRKEQFHPLAFDFAIVDRGRPLELLAGHDFAKPLASRQAGTLEVTNDQEAVEFEAVLPLEPPSWVVDAILAVSAGLIQHLSPGFFVPPKSVVSNAEELIREPGPEGVYIRKINHAVLREMSLVTNAAYEDSQVELRNHEERLEQYQRTVKPPSRAFLWL